MSATPESLLEPIARSFASLLTTRKRDGTLVGTPVNVAVEGSRVYISTPANTGKVKRLRNFPEVELVPSTLRGKPTGARVRAQARLLHGREAAAAAQAMARTHRIVHGFIVPLELRAKRTHGLYYELPGFRPGGLGADAVGEASPTQ